MGEGSARRVHAKNAKKRKDREELAAETTRSISKFGEI
jgi:hypothetical protein